MELESGAERFSRQDLIELSALVAAAWTAEADRDWSQPAGTLEWSCTETADHAVDCVYAPAFFLSSRRRDRYPEVGLDMTLGVAATPALLVESLQIATRILTAVVSDADPEARAVIFSARPGRSEALFAAPDDFLPRAALELILHAHDVCSGLSVPFEPPSGMCDRLREHTRPWPIWATGWTHLASSDDPWADLLEASGRQPLPAA